MSSTPTNNIDTDSREVMKRLIDALNNNTIALKSLMDVLNNIPNGVDIGKEALIMPTYSRIVAQPNNIDDPWKLPENRPKLNWEIKRMPDTNIKLAFDIECRRKHEFYLQYYDPDIGVGLDHTIRGNGSKLLNEMWQKVKKDPLLLSNVKTYMKNIHNLDFSD